MLPLNEAFEMKQFLVICQEACPTCRGSRVVPNPLWEQYFAETGGHGDADLWARENGMDCALDMGPEEEPCPDCDAQGTVQRLVPLVEALEHVKAEA